MTTQSKRGYENLWKALTHKPKDEVVTDMIDSLLSEQEAEQLTMRFGLAGESPTLVVETAHQLETDEASVRETEALALRKLRANLARSLHV